MIIESSGTESSGSTGDAGASSSTTASAGASAPAGGATDGAGTTGGAAAGAVDGAAAAAVAAYSPNFKYKFVTADGKDSEAEFDDMFKPLVKDAETEKKIRELNEKAHGIDFVKGDRDKIKQTYAQTTQELQGLQNGIQELRTFVQAGDLDSFFGTLEIPEQMVLQWALNKAQVAKLSPEQRAVYDAQVQQRRQMLDLQRQNQNLTQGFVGAQVQARTTELESTLARQEVTAISSAFDTKVGRPGAFRDEVIRRGQHYAVVEKRDVPAETIVMELMAHYGAFLAPATAPAAPAAPTIVQPNAKPVLPNITGKGTSPAKRVFNSIEDLKKRHDELAAGG